MPALRLLLLKPVPVLVVPVPVVVVPAPVGGGGRGGKGGPFQAQVGDTNMLSRVGTHTD